MAIEVVKRFYCPRCNYITEDMRSIERIEKQEDECPACGDGEYKVWAGNATAMRTCSHGIGYGWNCCSRKAVVEIGHSNYCKQHAIKELPLILILPNVDNKEGLKANLVKAMFGEP